MPMQRRWIAPAAAGRVDRTTRPTPYAESRRFGRALVVLTLLWGGSAAVTPGLLAQAEGAITGRTSLSGTDRGLPGVEILVDGRGGAVSDSAGAFRVRSVRAGWHQVSARLIGYRGVVLDSVQVPGGTSV